MNIAYPATLAAAADGVLAALRAILRTTKAIRSEWKQAEDSCAAFKGTRNSQVKACQWGIGAADGIVNDLGFIIQTSLFADVSGEEVSPLIADRLLDIDDLRAKFERYRADCLA